MHMKQIENYFDVVIFLTWSNWETEPRSNRYHYATRFAKHVPVLFLQNQRTSESGIAVTESGIPNLDIIDVASPISDLQVSEITMLVRHRGFKQALIWIYDSENYWSLLDALPRYFRVYHATEDYFTMKFEVGEGHIELRKRLKLLLKEIDLVVAVSHRVLENITGYGEYCGTTILSENACDYEFFEHLKMKTDLAPVTMPPVVIYQGGVNKRLDYDLVYSVAARMSDFKFVFLGNIVESEGVAQLRTLGNVSLVGEVSPETVGREMLKATVGIVPFLQDDLMFNSFPLKIFEYIACGLPIVSIPICALEKYKNIEGVIRFGSSVEDFESEIRSLAEVREDSDCLARREQLAKSNSYNIRFQSVQAAVVAGVESKRLNQDLLNVALLFDPCSVNVGTVKEHLEAFQRYSKNSYTFLPATNLCGQETPVQGVGPIELSVFDILVLHYSVRLSRSHHLLENFAGSVERFNGLKVLFIQDEHESVECAREWIDRLRFDMVYTCVPIDQRENIYPSFRYPATEFLPTLTGYIPESGDMDRFVVPLEARQKAIVYRGRELPPFNGKLGHEELVIGVEFAKRANEIGLPVDIACDERSLFHGEDRYRFLASGRATLGTEIGPNVFDFDSSLALGIHRLKKQHPGLAYEEVWDRILKAHDGDVRMNQIVPQIFEAIRLRTALVLFDGEYFGVVKPDVHFIPLRKDFSNFDEVVAKIMDDKLIREMTQRAYHDVIVSGQYSYQQFVKGVDRDLGVRCLRRQKRPLMYGAVYIAGEDGVFRQCLPAIPLGLPCAENVLSSRAPLQRIQEKYAKATSSGDAQCADSSTIVEQPATALSQPATALSQPAAMPSPMLKRLLVRYGIPVARRLHDVASRQQHVERGARWLYKSLPERVRAKVRKGIKGG